MTKQPEKSNRRASMRNKPRRALRMECRMGSMGLGPNLACECIDLSEGGMCGIVKAALKAGEVEVILTGMGGPPVKRLATVCWSQALSEGRYCVGIRFQKPITHREVMALSMP